MENNEIFVSELSVSKHTFTTYHFCRGNNSKRKTRIGIIFKGSGTYIYLSKKLKVKEGDVVFIPENIYCYSEWRGNPEIEVMYVNCFIHYGDFKYEPQILDCTDNVKKELIQIGSLLNEGYLEKLEAYSLFYRTLKRIIPKMTKSDIAINKTLQESVEYISHNWNNNFSISELAKSCCVSESTIYHMFKKEIGQSPVTFLNSIRINVAIEYLDNSNYSVSTISQLVGFNSENHFRKVFSDFTGTTPLKYRKSNTR